LQVRNGVEQELSRLRVESGDQDSRRRLRILEEQADEARVRNQVELPHYAFSSHLSTTITVLLEDHIQ